MGLTVNSTGKGAADGLSAERKGNECVIALAGNPNVGKSTLFNALTGMNQHTGNWAGKTVTNAMGRCSVGEREYILADLPGTYSLMAQSAEEEAARNFICFGGHDGAVVVCDATCLERNLNLVLQTIEITPKTLVCVNLLDEAEKKKIRVDLDKLSERLGVPTVGIVARTEEGLSDFKEKLAALTDTVPENPIEISYGEETEAAVELLLPSVEKALGGRLNPRWCAVRLLERNESILSALKDFLGFDILETEVGERLSHVEKILSDSGISPEKLSDKIVSAVIRTAEEIACEAVTTENETYYECDRKLDRILTHRIWGVPIMLALLGVVLWLTITGANYPSELLSNLLFRLGEIFADGLAAISAPQWLSGMLIDGIYRTLAWVVSVMLPPMAIFFPLFTLLEDLGYLPRVAFNLDKHFKKANACGKQALCMCMGFGCNAAGVVGCRIIDSPRERLIATITNNFVPCNGRFPALIAIITMFFVGTGGGFGESALSALMLTGMILLGIAMTFLVSRFLSKTVLKGVPSGFTLELPPYRKPQIGKILVRSIFDRTLFVLGRAVAVAAPCGLLIWILANTSVGGGTLLAHCSGFLDPFASFIGLDGVILLAFILGFPANEIVIPIIIMAYMAEGKILGLESLEQMRALFVENGWTPVTALCTMLFCMFHFPCSTTCMTIKKETGSAKWTALSILIPTATGILICGITANIARLFTYII